MRKKRKRSTKTEMALKRRKTPTQEQALSALLQATAHYMRSLAVGARYMGMDREAFQKMAGTAFDEAVY